MKTLLITGADGFIGRRMCVAAQAAGWNVIGLDRAAPSAEIPKVQAAKSQRAEGEGSERTEDRGQKAACRPACSHALSETGACEHADLRGPTEAVRTQAPTLQSEQEPGTRNPKLETPRGEAAWLVADLTADAPIELPAGIDAIIHLAGKAHALAEVAQDEADYFRINTEGTRRMLEAAQRAGVRAFVLFSTVKAAGDAPAEVTSDKGQGPSDGKSQSPRGQTPKSNDDGIGSVATPEGRPACLHALPPAGACEHAGLQGRGSDVSANQCASVVNPNPKREIAGACEHADLQGRGSEVSANQCTSVVNPNPKRETRNPKPGAALDESCDSPPATPYGQSKRAAEALVLNGGYVPHPAVLRPCLVYGPTPKGNLEKMIAAVRRGRFPPLPEVGNKRSMVHVDDVIAAALLAAEHPAAAGRIFVVADNEPFSTRQLFEWICTAAGRRVPGWTMPLWTLRLLGRVGDGIGRLRGRRFVFDSDALSKLTGNAWYSSAKLQRELGWKPAHTLRETMPEVLRSAKP